MKVYMHQCPGCHHVYETQGPFRPACPRCRGEIRPKVNPKEAAGRAKRQLQLLPPEVLDEVAEVMEHGAAKYGAWNWRLAGIQLTTYIGASLRHVFAIARGEDTDPDSGKSHWAHLIACALVVRDAQIQGTWTDDRVLVRSSDKAPPLPRSAADVRARATHHEEEES